MRNDRRKEFKYNHLTYAWNKMTVGVFVYLIILCLNPYHTLFPYFCRSAIPTSQALHSISFFLLWNSISCTFRNQQTMASNDETPEARAFREHYSTLVKAIQDPDTIADELFSKRILSREVLMELQSCNLSTAKKNGKMLQCVYDHLVFIDPSKLQVFTDILRQEAYAVHLSDKLEASYREFSANCKLWDSKGIRAYYFGSHLHALK